MALVVEIGMWRAVIRGRAIGIRLRPIRILILRMSRCGVGLRRPVRVRSVARRRFLRPRASRQEHTNRHRQKYRTELDFVLHYRLGSVPLLIHKFMSYICC